MGGRAPDLSAGLPLLKGSTEASAYGTALGKSCQPRAMEQKWPGPRTTAADSVSGL